MEADHFDGRPDTGAVIGREATAKSRSDLIKSYTSDSGDRAMSVCEILSSVLKGTAPQFLTNVK